VASQVANWVEHDSRSAKKLIRRHKSVWLGRYRY